ncbi:MAG: amidohydrolase family protein [Candidatus Thermoplasmatota archaeon]|jgi:imidazolonepropionase-like amidohydrolase|nr:amidohydrolase family protein [Candidatus Thermoplasmatota archaeon]MCL5793498.1 amidohydrolase family protein [Candidatus Thermoplasmatota archaeon]
MNALKANVLYDGDSVKKNVYVGFSDKIEYVGSEKPDAEIMGEGVVTPAFIDGHSHIGMVRSGEPSAEEESNEHMDPVLPMLRAIDSVYMDDAAFQESVENGVLYSTVLPGSGNVLGGMGQLIRNFATNVKDAHIKDVGVKVAFGYNPRSTVDWKGDRPYTRMGALAILRERLIKARKIRSIIQSGKKTMDEIDPGDEVFLDILDGKHKLMAHTHKADDAYVLMDLARTFGIRIILNHGLDITDLSVLKDLSAQNIPLIYGPMDSLPYKVELKHETWRNARIVMDSGIKFGLMSDHPVILQRNIFLTLRHFLRFGMSKEEAISHLTSTTAEIIEAENIGRVRNGYDASLVLWNKDPFDLEAHPVMVFGEGKKVFSD